MTSEAWAAIIAAIITAFGTIVAAKFNEISQILTKSKRDISGDWQITSKRVKDDSWVGEYDLKLKQRGTKVTGEMRAINVEEGKKKHSYIWSGKVIGEYLVYDCVCTTPGTFMISNGMLHLHAAGEVMTGNFIANRGSDKEIRTWLGSVFGKRK